jgi:hypothetical protein
VPRCGIEQCQGSEFLLAIKAVTQSALLFAFLYYSRKNVSCAMRRLKTLHIVCRLFIGWPAAMGALEKPKYQLFIEL